MINEISQFGFNFGPAKVKRICSDEKKGWVLLGISTEKQNQSIDVYVTKTGKTRVYKNGIELK